MGDRHRGGIGVALEDEGEHTAYGLFKDEPGAIPNGRLVTCTAKSLGDLVPMLHGDTVLGWHLLLDEREKAKSRPRVAPAEERHSTPACAEVADGSSSADGRGSAIPQAGQVDGGRCDVDRTRPVLDA